MSWLNLAFLTLLFYGVFDLFVKLASGKIHDGLGGFVINLVATMVLALFLLYSSINGEKINYFKTDGLIYAIIAGILVGFASIFFIKMFSAGADLSLGTPLVRVGTMLVSALIGVIFLKEGFNPKFLMGFLLSMSGIYLLVTS